MQGGEGKHLQSDGKSGIINLTKQAWAQCYKILGGEQFENAGLAGGAIAGIVIACVVVAGLGGFAIFWFAIRKKTFADLIALFKKK